MLVSSGYSYASQVEITIAGFVFNTDTSDVYTNFPITIYPNLNDTTKSYTTYSNDNGYYFYTFFAESYSHSLVKIKRFCNNKWIVEYDTLRLNANYLVHDFYFCHDPFWYMTKMFVYGQVTDIITGLPVSDHQVIFNPGSYSDYSYKFKTDKNGLYSDTVLYDIFDTAKYTLSTYSFCSRKFEIVTEEFYPSVNGYSANFEICTDTLDAWNVAFYYKTYPNSNKIYFQQISNFEVDSVKWDFGDNSVGRGFDVIHDYEHGSYKITMTSFLNGIKKKYSKRIIIGNNITGVRGNVWAYGNPLDSGHVIAYNVAKSTYSITNVADIENGSFYFDNNLFKGEYLLYAIPSFKIDTLFFPKYIATYNSGNAFWTNSATVIIDETTEEINIELNKYTFPYYGNCRIVFSVDDKILFNHDIANVLLFNSEDEIINSTPILSKKEVYFDNLPEGFYTVKIEIPGVFCKPAQFFLSDGTEPNLFFFLEDQNAVDYSITSNFSIEQEKILLFPNPFTEKIFLQGIDENCTVNIFNINGSCVHSQKISSNQEISLQALAAGAYIVVIQKDSSILERKIIIKN